jgi:hypothetical protein
MKLVNDSVTLKGLNVNIPRRNRGEGVNACSNPERVELGYRLFNPFRVNFKIDFRNPRISPTVIQIQPFQGWLSSSLEMTRLKIVLVILLSIAIDLTNISAQANNQQGIFLSWQDYRDHKMISVEKIKLNHLLSGVCLDATENGKSVRYCKDSIFGYSDESGKAYRFYKQYDDEYQVLEYHEIVIYVIYKPTYTSKGLSEPLVPMYFFSKALNTEIMRLTVPNLINAFPELHTFHHELEDEFKNGTPVSLYDEQHKMFMVNYLLSLSKNKSE